MTCKFGFAFIGLSGPLPCLVGLGSALRSGHCISWSFTDFGPCLEVLVVLFLTVVFQYRRISRPCLAGPGFADLGLLLGLSLENFGQFSATLLLRFLSSFLRSFSCFCCSLSSLFHFCIILLCRLLLLCLSFHRPNFLFLWLQELQIVTDAD